MLTVTADKSMEEQTGQDRRAYPRFACSGEACLRITPTWPSARGTILNLCLRGCMIEFPARQKVEAGQPVDLVFCVHNLPFHVLALVRGERGKGRYGFEFPYLRDRVREQLQELLEELEHGSFNAELGSKGAVRLR